MIFSFILFSSWIVSMSGLHGDGILNACFFFSENQNMWNFELSFQALFRPHAAKEQLKQAYEKHRANVTTNMILDYSKHHVCPVPSWREYKQQNRKGCKNSALQAEKALKANTHTQAQTRCTHGNNSKCWTNWITASHIFPVL